MYIHLNYKCSSCISSAISLRVFTHYVITLEGSCAVSSLSVFFGSKGRIGQRNPTHFLLQPQHFFKLSLWAFMPLLNGTVESRKESTGWGERGGWDRKRTRRQESNSGRCEHSCAICRRTSNESISANLIWLYFWKRCLTLFEHSLCKHWVGTSTYITRDWVVDVHRRASARRVFVVKKVYTFLFLLENDQSFH